MSAGSAGWWQNDRMMSLRNRLTFWFTCLLTIVGVGGGIVAYVMARQDPDSFLDDQLRQISIFAVRVRTPSSDAVSPPTDASGVVVVQGWDGDNRMIPPTPEGFALPRQAAA